MNRKISGLLGVLAALTGAAVGCKSDPTADGVGSAVAVTTDFSAFLLNPGDSTTFIAWVVDNRQTPVAGDITFTSCNPAVVTVAPDPTYDPVPPLKKRAVVHAVKAPQDCVVASSPGVKPDTVWVGVVPESFDGALSSTTPLGGDTLVISGTADLQFDPAAAVKFANGVTGTLVSTAADQLQVLVPFGGSGPLTISGVVVTYAPGLTVTLPTVSTVTQTGDLWAGSADPATAPDITGVLPGAGGTDYMIVAMPAVNNASKCPQKVLGLPVGSVSVGPCAWFKFTLADSGTVRFTVDWLGTATAPNVDIYVCSSNTADSTSFATTCFEGGKNGVSNSKPQNTLATYKYTPGDHWLVIENRAGATPSTNHFVKIDGR